MIADLLAKRKKVLFVSEKIAALEVVHNRLKEAGLHEFVLEIHSHKTTRKEMARALGRGVQTRVSGKSSMSETDRERLRRRRAQLSEYVEAVNTPRAPLNQTLHYAVGQIAGLQQQPQAPQPSLEFEQIDQGLMSTIIDSAEAIARTWGPIARGDSFLWHELAEGSWSQGRRFEILGLLDRALQALSRLEETAEAVAEELALYPPDFVLYVGWTFDFIPVVWLLRRVPRSAGHAALPATGIHATTPRTVAGRPSICQPPDTTSAAGDAATGGRVDAGWGSRPCRIRGHHPPADNRIRIEPPQAAHLHPHPRRATAASGCPRPQSSRSRRCSRFGEIAPWCPRTSAWWAPG